MNSDTTTHGTLDDVMKIVNQFMYHPPHGDQTERYEILRAEARNLVLKMLAFCPQSAERSVAIRKLRESVMWANAAIACNEVKIEDKKTTGGSDG